MLDQLRTLITQLRFRGMEAALEAEIERAERGSVSAVDLLYRMLLEETASKRERSLAYRLQEARMPWNWSLESFPFEQQPGIDKRQIQTLAGLEFLRRTDNVLLIGPIHYLATLLTKQVFLIRVCCYRTTACSYCSNDAWIAHYVTFYDPRCTLANLTGTNCPRTDHPQNCHLACR
jgi:DNA replication protein DnaC